MLPEYTQVLLTLRASISFAVMFQLDFLVNTSPVVLVKLCERLVYFILISVLTHLGHYNYVGFGTF